MLTISAITKRYGDRTVLDDVSFDVARGRLTGFVGGNGAGKTTSMRIVLGRHARDRGEVTRQGEPRPTPRRRGQARWRTPHLTAPPRVRIHAGGARPLPKDEGARADPLPRPAARLRQTGRLGQGAGDPRGTRPRRAPVGSDRGALAREPAA